MNASKKQHSNKEISFPNSLLFPLNLPSLRLRFWSVTLLVTLVATSSWVVIKQASSLPLFVLRYGKIPTVVSEPTCMILTPKGYILIKRDLA